jgi:hypothetical protein
MRGLVGRERDVRSASHAASSMAVLHKHSSLLAFNLLLLVHFIYV